MSKEEELKAHATKFAYWISNNWYKPYGRAGNWVIIDREPPSEKTPTYTTEQLYEKFKLNN